MSEYTKTTWQTGDIITAEKLNNMEDGIANANSGGALTQIRVDSEGNVTSIAKNLSAKDFAGKLIDNDGMLEIICDASEDSETGTVTADTRSWTLVYTKATGEIEATDNT